MRRSDSVPRATVDDGIDSNLKWVLVGHDVDLIVIEVRITSNIRSRNIIVSDNGIVRADDFR